MKINYSKLIMESTQQFNLRVKQLDQYREYLDTAKLRINSILHKLDLDPHFLQKQQNLTICPLNACHRVSSNMLEKEHIQKCKLTQNGYMQGQQLYPDVWVPSGARYSMKIGPEEMNKILNKTINDRNNKDYECPPQSLDRYQSMFSSAERLQIYEHILKNTDCQKLFETCLNINLNEMDFSEQSNNLSLPEELAKQRDMKRRRAKYRKAGYGGYKRELRDMIEAQMEMYAKFFKRNSEMYYENSMQETNTIKYIETSTIESVVQKEINVDENYKKLPDQLTYNGLMSSGEYSQHFGYHRNNYHKQEYKHNHNKNHKELFDENSISKRPVSDYVRDKPQHIERKIENVQKRHDGSQSGNSVSKGHFSDKPECIEKNFGTSQKRYDGYENDQCNYPANKKYLLNELQDKHSHNDNYPKCSPSRSHKYGSNGNHHSKRSFSKNDGDLKKSNRDKKRHKKSKHKSHKHKTNTKDSNSDSSTTRKRHKKHKKSDKKF